MIKDFDIKLWRQIHHELLMIAAPILIIVVVLYSLCVLFVPLCIIFLPLLYIFIAGVCRELYWFTDLLMSKVNSYDAMKKYLWSYIQRPPSRTTWCKMYIIWLLMFRPCYECRIHRLKRKHHAD